MKKTHIKTYIIIAILISIVGISIAYAALSQQLQIKTTTTVQSSQTSWNITIKKDTCSTVGHAVLGTFEVNGTTITISGFVLKAPKDVIGCYFFIENKGEVAVKIASVNYQEPAISGTGSNAEADKKLVASNLSHSLVWSDSGNVDVKEGVVIPAESSRYVRVMFLLNSSMTTLPTNPVTFSNAVYTINFEQA